MALKPLFALNSSCASKCLSPILCLVSSSGWALHEKRGTPHLDWNTSLVLWKASALCKSSESSASHHSTSDSTVSAWVPFLERKHIFFTFLSSPLMWRLWLWAAQLRCDLNGCGLLHQIPAGLLLQLLRGQEPTWNGGRYAAATSISRHSKQGPNLLSGPLPACQPVFDISVHWHFRLQDIPSWGPLSAAGSPGTLLGPLAGGQEHLPHTAWPWPTPLGGQPHGWREVVLQLQQRLHPGQFCPSPSAPWLWPLSHRWSSTWWPKVSPGHTRAWQPQCWENFVDWLYLFHTFLCLPNVW